MKKIEFQVKLYEEKSSVLSSHANTSKKLLEQKKIDYVHFVTTSEFSKTLVSELKETYPERVGGVYPLTRNQQAYLSLLAFYETIFNKQLTPSYVKFLLKEGLGIDIGDYFSLISKVPKISVTSAVQPTITSYESKIPESPPVKQRKVLIMDEFEEKTPVLTPKSDTKKIYPSAVEDILLFMYRRAGRYKWQTTFNFLKGKILNYRDEEVKDAFYWLKNNSNYTDNISSTSIKLNGIGISFLESLNMV